jgi:hypothetical protein
MKNLDCNHALPYEVLQWMVWLKHRHTYFGFTITIRYAPLPPNFAFAYQVG